MFGQPSLVPGNGGGNPQSKTLLPQQRVAPIPTPKRLDLPPLGEVGDGDILGITGPGVVVGGTRGQGNTDGVETADKVFVAESLEDAHTHPRHLLHAHHDVGRVCELDPDLADVGAEWSHAVGDEVHRPTCNTTTHTVIQWRCPSLIQTPMGQK